MKKSVGKFFLSCKECILENPRSFYGSFSLGPFQNSQSLTVANALRRTLFTEIFGLAITSVSIDEVLHEYSTLDGVRESVLDILFNLKHIVFKSSKPFKKPVYGYLNVRGPGIVRISDVKLPPHIQCVDPDQYIATLNENGKLSLKIVLSDFSCSSEVSSNNLRSDFSSSANLSRIDNQKKHLFGNAAKEQENFLAVDATFHPIFKVNYSIENLQPVQQNIQNQVVHIELWTNGSIHPRKALNSAILFLKNMFDTFEDMERISSGMYREFFESDKNFVKILKSFEYDFRFYGSAEANQRTIFPSTFLENGDSLQIPRNSENEVSNFEKNERISLDSSIEILKLPYRISECLKHQNIFTIGDIVKYRQKEFSKVCQIGNFAVCVLQKKLKKLGYGFQS